MSDSGKSDKSKETSLSVVPDVEPEKTVEDEPVIAEPAKLEAAPKRPWPKRLWHSLTGSRRRRVVSVLALILIVVAVIGFTPLKYPVLGWAVKADVVVNVTDGDTHQLLPGASVSVAGQTVITDKTGTARFTKIHPGKTTLNVVKSAYEGWTDNVTIKFGDNGTTDARLTSTGIRVSFNLTNYVTGKPVGGVRVQLADADVVAASDGTVAASVTPDNDGKTLSAKITGDGYNDQTVSVKIVPGGSPVAAKVVPAGLVYFLSNRSGKVDLYQANLDGTDPAVILAGTGNEDTSTGILANVYDPSVIALVSSRAGHRINGELAEDLYIFRPATKQLTLVQSGYRYATYRTWLGKTLMYQTYGDTAGAQRQTIQAYDTTTGKNTTVATCTSDGACPTALFSNDDVFLYAMSGAPAGSSSAGIFVVKNGSVSAKTLSTTPATSYDQQVKNTLLLNYYGYQATGSYGQIWQSLDLDSSKISSLTAGPSNPTNRNYVDSPGDKYSVYVDTRDGQSDLYLTNEDGSNERQLTTTGNISEFVQWFGDDYIVYSAASQLFVVGVNGGKPQKITNFYSGSVQGYGGGYNPSYY